MTEQIHVRARKFLQEFFNDEDLTNFCFDYFPQVYNDFTQGMPKSQKVRMLVENSQRRGRFDELLAALERERPKSYPDHFAEKSHLIDPRPQPTETIKRDPRQIFISHAHQDIEFAQRLATDLQANGWQTWMAPDNIRPGEKWVEAINRGLSESGVFVLIITPESVNSRWVKTETNVAIGIEHRGEIQFLPLNIKPTSTPALWEAYQWIAFDDSYEAGLVAVLSELKPHKEGLPVLTRATQPKTQEKQEEPKPNIEAMKTSTIQAEKTPLLENEKKPDSPQTINERIKTMPTQLLYGGGGFVLMVVLLVIFWPDSNNDPNVEPTEVAEIFVLETEDPATSTATATPTMTVTSTVILSATPSPSQTPSPTPTIAPSVPPPNAELGDIWVRPKDGMVMVFVPPPDEPFTLESGVDAPMEGYWIDKFEVSNAQYQLCVDAGICEPAAFINDDRFNGAEYPVVRVSAIDAEAYGYWVGGILPTKEEWEWAAFGDTGFRYPWGDEFDEMRVNICDLNCLLDGRLVSIDDGYRYTAPVDSFPEGANWVNALNMSGNVWEWTASELEYNGHMSRYLKGGAWNTPGIDYGTVAYTILRNYNVGFRLVVHNTNTLSP